MADTYHKALIVFKFSYWFNFKHSKIFKFEKNK